MSQTDSSESDFGYVATVNRAPAALDFDDMCEQFTGSRYAAAGNPKPHRNLLIVHLLIILSIDTESALLSNAVSSASSAGAVVVAALSTGIF